MSTLPNKAHAEKRKGQSPAFAMNLLVGMESYVDSCLNSFCDLLDRQISKAQQGTATVEMAEYMQLVRGAVVQGIVSSMQFIDQISIYVHCTSLQLALDTIGELAFGKSFELCEAGRDVYGFLPDLLSFTFGACLAGESVHNAAA